MADNPEPPPEVTRVDAGAPPPPPPEPPIEKKSTYESLKERIGSAATSVRAKASGAAERVRRFVSREKKSGAPSAYSPMKTQHAATRAQDRAERMRELKQRIRESTERVKAKTKVIAMKAKEKAYSIGKKAGVATRESDFYKGAQLGYQESKAKLKAGIQEGVYATGRETGRLPITLAKYGVKKAKEFQTDVRVASSKGWHAGLLQHPGAAGRASTSTYRPTFHPHATVGRQPRIKVGKGIIKTYWSKKLKKLARSNIRKFGETEGMARTRQVAQLSGWKMQERRV